MAGLSAVLCTATCAAAQVAEMPVQQLEEEVESIGKDKNFLKVAKSQKILSFVQKLNKKIQSFKFHA